MISVRESIVRFRKPVLIVHGDADETVPVSCAREASGLYEDASLVVLQGDTHCYDYHMDLMFQAVRDFLLKLRPY